jgi:hypothetical protein
VFNHEYELGGTLDLYSVKDRIIADIKTNNPMKAGKKGNFIKPLNKVKVNNLNKVRLQAKTYEVLVEEECARFVYHWDGEFYNVIELEDIDVQPILEIRKQELEKARLVKNMF